MSVVMDEEIKRWTARRKSALILKIIQGKTTVAEASRQYDLTPEYVRLIAESEFNGNPIRKRRETASSRDYAKDLPPAG